MKVTRDQNEVAEGAMEVGDEVYGLHPFDAENPDEISFGTGEKIVVLQRDDQYGDGWWEGRNEKGEVGLFPQSYTSPTKPATLNGNGNGIPAIQTEDETTSGEATETRSESDAPNPSHGPVMAATMTDIQNAINLLGTSPRQNGDGHSVRSVGTRGEGDLENDAEGDEESRDGDWHAKAREALAAQAREESERRAEEERRREQGKRLKVPNMPSLELSDESDVDEEEVEEEPSKKRDDEVVGGPTTDHYDEGPKTPLGGPSRDEAFPKVKQVEVPQEEEEDVRADSAHVDVRESHEVHQEEPRTPPSEVPLPADQHDESSSLLSGDKPSSEQSVTPVIASKPKMDDESQHPAHAAVVEQSHSEDHGTPTLHSESHQAGTTSLVAAGATGAGAVAAAAADAIGSFFASTKDSDPPTPVQQPSSPVLPEEEQHTGVPVTSAPATSVPRQSIDQARQIRPEPPRPMSRMLSLQSSRPIVGGGATAAAGGPSEEVYGAHSQPSPVPLTPHTTTSSRASSRMETLPTGSSQHSTMDTSPRSSRFGQQQVKGPHGSDPKGWGVAEVVEWGRANGFDNITLGKFIEHEITGDVLLEMDVTTLKEIDLPAFGRRVHIAKAIKELKKSYETPPPMPSPSYPPSFISPSLSGYEPDSPASRAFSPQDAFSPHPHAGIPANAIANANVVMSPESNAGLDDVAIRQSPERQRKISDGVSVVSHVGRQSESDGLRGLGFEGGHARVPVASEANTIQDGSKARRRIPVHNEFTHRRTNTNGTAETFNTADEKAVDLEEPLVEEDEEESVNGRPDRLTVTDSEISGLQKRSSKTRQQKSIMSKKQSASANASSSSIGTRRSRDPSEPETESEGKRNSSRPASTPTSPSTLLSRSDTGIEKASKFFTQTLGRSRKPPPKVPSGLIETLERNERQERLGTAGRNSIAGAKRSTRLFVFPSSTSTSASDTLKASISPPLEAGPNMLSVNLPEEEEEEPVTTLAPAPVIQPVVSEEPLRKQLRGITFEGKLRKKGEKYNSWKSRHLFLDLVPSSKGEDLFEPYLYVLKDYDSKKAKAIINLAGYKVVPSAEEPGYYGFKLTHESGPTHSFSSDDPSAVKNWMKDLIKATIGRDFKSPVISSSNIATIPLSVAQSMVPRPRPPSPTSRSRVQKAHFATEEEMQQRVSTMMAASQGMQKSHRDSVMRRGLSDQGSSRASVIGTSPRQTSSGTGPALDSSPRPAEPRPTKSSRRKPASSSPQTVPRSLQPPLSPQRGSSLDVQSPEADPKEQQLLEWLYETVPVSEGFTKANTLSKLRSGRQLVRVCESLSGTPSGIEDEEFPKTGTSSIDTWFKIFDYFNASGVSLDGIPLNAVIEGDKGRMETLIGRIRERFNVE